MKNIFLFLSLLVFSIACRAQVGINILIPDSSAALQVESNNKGLGLPRLSSTQRDNISNPLKGLTIFNTTDSFVEYWTGLCWIRTYEKSCNECLFSMQIDDPNDTLDRVLDDSVFAVLDIKKLKSTHIVNVIYQVIPPTGVQVYAQGNTNIDTTGQIKIVLKADIFAGEGTVPIIIQAFCGDEVKYLVYNVYIEPCVKVTIPADAHNYNLQAMNSTVLPAGSKKCVVLTINNSVSLFADSSAVPAYNTGNLHAQSKVGIINNGAILGSGGDGAGMSFTGSLVTVGGTHGGNGGNAMQLTTKTILVNNGAIFGGGGGGGSVGLFVQSPSIPIIGQITIGAGFGGGGGSESGNGGNAPSGAATLGIFRSGTDASGGLASTPGVGGSATTTIPINISVATINITPNAHGGNGAAFAQTGGSGYIDINIQACVSVPFIGNICIPIPIPGGLLPFNGPSGGYPGLAVKRNGNSLQNLPDGSYSGNQVKGVVAP